MLFEQVARRVINIEELEYALSTDVSQLGVNMPYEASCQSRFNTPEIIAVLGDVVRRLRLLKGTRPAADTDSDTDTYTDTDTDSDTDTDADADTGTDADTYTDLDTEAIDADEGV